MKIAFLSLNGTYNYPQIGGTDSLMRRLCAGLLEQDMSLGIDWVFYGCPERALIEYLPRLKSVLFPTLREALKWIESVAYRCVVIAYIHPKDRTILVKFRMLRRKSIFHSIIFFYPENLLTRFVKFSEYFLFPYTGKVFCVSKRQQKYLERYGVRSVYLPPPVPDYYYLTPSQKTRSDKIRIRFIGRIDPRKGVDDVLHLFCHLNTDDRFDLSIQGICIPHDKGVQQLRNRLKHQRLIQYLEVQRSGHNPSVEEELACTLRNTDIFVQPYKNLHTTLDTPLLVLEAMASLCCVLTTPVGDIPSIYGPSPFLIGVSDFWNKAMQLLTHISFDAISAETDRIFNNSTLQNFRLSKVAWDFRNEID